MIPEFDGRKNITSIEKKKSFNFILNALNFVLFSGEKALIEFLQEEIASEKENLAGHLPSELDGFQIDFSGADVELKKRSGNET